LLHYYTSVINFQQKRSRQ